jgi:hypothetical protein
MTCLILSYLHVGDFKYIILIMFAIELNTIMGM